MMNKYLYDLLDSLAQELYFEYEGKPCLVSPVTRQDIDLCYGDFEGHYTSIEEVLSAKVFHGKSLNEIADVIELMN